MFKTTGFLTTMLFLTSCSFYSSAGRKQFEEKAPASVQGFSLQSCRDLSAAETWFKEEFPSRTHELVEMTPDYEVWGTSLLNGQVDITVLTKTENNSTESCVYKFDSKSAWWSYKKTFLDSLARSLVNIN